MGQEDIAKFLEKNKDEWFSSKMISKAIGVNISSVTISLKKLRMRQDIEFRNAGLRAGYEYKHKE